MSSTLTEHDMSTELAELQAMFPLPLSDFEYYMHVDDRPTHPMVFVMVVTIAGHLKRSEFQDALDAAITANPLFRSNVRTLPRGICWVLSSQTSWPVEWQAAATDCFEELLPIRSIDLTCQTGIQVVVREGLEKSQVVFYLHHACCDGLGGLQFIGEVLARYGQRTVQGDQRAPEFSAPSLQQLLARERFECGAGGTERQKKSLKKSLAKAARLIFRKPVALSGSAAAPMSSSVLPTESSSSVDTESSIDQVPVAIRSRVLTRSEFRAVRAAAQGLQVSVNDICIRELMLLIRDWNQRHGELREKDWIRVAVPLSMRNAVHDRMPAANLVSYAFVTRRASECRDPKALAESIHAQTGDTLYNREGIVFLKCIHVLRKLPGALRLLLGLKSCFCTVVLANVGDIRRRFNGRFPLDNGQWVAGNVVVEDIWGVAPVRPNTRAALTIGEYGGQMTVHLRTDSTVLSSTASEQFLTEFVERLIRVS